MNFVDYYRVNDGCIGATGCAAKDIAWLPTAGQGVVESIIYEAEGGAVAIGGCGPRGTTLVRHFIYHKTCACQQTDCFACVVQPTGEPLIDGVALPCVGGGRLRQHDVLVGGDGCANREGVDNAIHVITAQINGRWAGVIEFDELIGGLCALGGGRVVVDFVDDDAGEEGEDGRVRRGRIDVHHIFGRRADGYTRLLPLHKAIAGVGHRLEANGQVAEETACEGGGGNLHIMHQNMAHARVLGGQGEVGRAICCIGGEAVLQVGVDVIRPLIGKSPHNLYFVFPKPQELNAIPPTRVAPFGNMGGHFWLEHILHLVYDGNNPCGGKGDAEVGGKALDKFLAEFCVIDQIA